MRSQTITTQLIDDREWRAAPVDPSGWLTGRPARGIDPLPDAGSDEPAVPPPAPRKERSSAGRAERQAARVRRLRKAKARAQRAAVAAADSPAGAPVEPLAPSGLLAVPTPERSEGYRVSRWARLALTLTVLAAVVVVTVSLSAGSAPTAFVDVTVGPGDTLWSIAQKASPDRDPRAVIEEIRQLNDVPTDILPLGIVVRVPSSSD